MFILGISAFYHDSSACLIKDGHIIAAAQEERFSRKKHDSEFPCRAIKYCLNEAKINSNEILNVVFYEKPFSKFERLIETYLAFAPRGFRSFSASMPIWIKEKLFQKYVIIRKLKKTLGSNIDWSKKLMFSEHHLSHAASVFYPSPFKKAAVLTIDGVGEWTTTSIAIGNSNKLNIIKEILFPHSIGLLYSAFTFYLGFKVNSGEYKVMGLAPYGKPIYSNLIKEKLITIADDGSFHIDMSYFDYATGLKMTNKKFHKLFAKEPRTPGSDLTQKDMDLAASIQEVTAEIVVKIAKNVKKETNLDNLCLAGGVALNCVINGILLKKNIFKNIWIQPAAGDAGGSLGAALVVFFLHYNNQRKLTSNHDSMNGSFLGPSYTNKFIGKELKSLGANFRKVSENELIEEISTALVSDKAIGWMQGRMEFGPRSLGSRSIIANPCSTKMQKDLNMKVKFRESFRPFAPSVLEEHKSEWFDIDVSSPYMQLVTNVLPEKCKTLTKKQKKISGLDKLNIVRSEIPAVTHVDFTARIQTVNKKNNRLFYSLISRFYQKTGYPIVVNTSFNVRGEPIVCSPKDAFNCFMGTGIDILVIGNYILHKSYQKKYLYKNYKNKYELD